MKLVHPRVYSQMEFFIKSNSPKIMNHLTAHTFQRDFTYIISFEFYRILWARQGRNHNLHVREELRASYGHVVGEWLGQIHMVFWPRVECPNDLYVHVHVLIISPGCQVSLPSLFSSLMKNTISPTTKTIFTPLKKKKKLPKQTSSSTFSLMSFLILTC